VLFKNPVSSAKLFTLCVIRELFLKCTTKNGKGSAVFYFKVLSWHSPGRIDKHHENLQIREKEWQLRLKLTTSGMKVSQADLLDTLLHY
jgi:hypothetical protein